MLLQTLTTIFDWDSFLTHYYPITPECWHFMLSKGVVL